MNLNDVHCVEERLKKEGFKPFEVELGGRGVSILENADEELMEEFEHGVGAIGKDHIEWKYWR